MVVFVVFGERNILSRLVSLSKFLSVRLNTNRWSDTRYIKIHAHLSFYGSSVGMTELSVRHVCINHYTDVIMGATASQIPSLTIVYSTVYSDADQRKHQSSASLAFVMNSPGAGEFPAQMASNAENVSIRWRHHEVTEASTYTHIYLYGYTYTYTSVHAYLSKQSFNRIQMHGIPKHYIKMKNENGLLKWTHELKWIRKDKTTLHTHINSTL